MDVEYLHHYTDRGALWDIVCACVRRPSDAQWGYGVYLTDLPPTVTRPRLSQLFGRRRFSAERLDAYVRIHIWPSTRLKYRFQRL